MKKTLLLTLMAVWIGGCTSSPDYYTVDVDSANMDKYPAGMVINGHTLPPEPDPKVNNKTLLGIDSNGNGVRDDVERFLIISDGTLASDHYPKIWTAIDMQFARADFAFIKEQTPKTTRMRIDALNCQEYFIDHGIKKHGYTGPNARDEFTNEYVPPNTSVWTMLIYHNDMDLRKSYERKYLQMIPDGNSLSSGRICETDLTQTGEW